MKRKELLNLLEKVKSSPESYLGCRSITRLASFIDGFYFGAGEQGAISDPLFRGFQDWVCENYRIAPAQRWEEVILFFARDEAIALRKFFVLFEEYRKTKTE